MQERETKKLLHDGIEQQKMVNLKKEQDIKNRWHECQQYFLKHAPPVDTSELYIFKHITPSIEQPHIAPQALTKLIDNTKKALVKKVQS